jgi:hypothetical protein
VLGNLIFLRFIVRPHHRVAYTIRQCVTKGVGSGCVCL